MQPNRHHPAFFTLQWLLALMLFVALGMGTFALKTGPNNFPDKIGALQVHMIAGTLILLLTLLRLFVRLKTTHPAPATSGNALLDRPAPATHSGLYVLVFLMAGSGIAMTVLAGLPGIVFAAVGSLPVNFDALAPRAAHGGVAKLLMLAMGLHIAAALYHQFIRRDRLLAHIGFGQR